VCGHIHEGRGIDTIGRTIVANCGAAFAGHYGRIEFGPEIAVDLRRA
jgi:Icc-related predicted phosphoesterase